MKKLLFASHNANKIKEVRSMVSGPYEILGLHDVGLTEDIPEPYDTFEANAQAKAFYCFSKTGIPSFSDDSGLEVDALGGKPGVLSARYAGTQKSDADNITKLLSELEHMDARDARFVAVFAYQVDEEQCYFFRGTVEGKIGLQPTGDGGFGYDPVFIPKGFDKSFGELNAGIKKAISHRAKAMDKLLGFLTTNTD
jgi:XTP/dITP diphosphohydrolase